MPSQLETERLLLLPWTAEDVGLLSRLAADPRVVRYVGTGMTWSAAKALERSDAQVERWRQLGFGWRVAVDKWTGTQLGFIALNYMGEGTAHTQATDHEIGWWLDPQAWGNGYAAEGARAVVHDAFTELNAPHLTARIMPTNDASIQVALSLGMAHTRDTVVDPDIAACLYQCTNPAGRT